MSALDITLILLAGAVLYGLATVILAARCRLPESSVEWIELELPTLGHHVALHHHAPEERRFVEPLILCHGLGANRFNMDFSDDGTGSDRLSIARALARAGFDVWVLELRGRGRARVPSGARWTADDEVREDLPIAIDGVLDLTGAERCFWVGHSWGGILQYLLHSRRHPAAEKIAGLVTISSPGTLRHQRRGQLVFRWPGLALAKLGVKVPLRIAAKLGLPASWLVAIAGRIVFADLRAMDGPVVRRVFASLADDINPGVVLQGLDWLAAGDFSSKEGTADEPAFAPIGKPALLLVGSHDRICPAASVKHIADRIDSGDVTCRVMGTATGCKSDYGHGSILLGRDAPDEVFPIIRGWLAARATRVSQATKRPPGANGASKTNGIIG